MPRNASEVNQIGLQDVRAYTRLVPEGLLSPARSPIQYVSEETFLMYKCTLSCLVLAGSLSVPMSAAVVYDEAVSGQLSSTGLSPTAVTVAGGSNLILGTNGNLAPSVRDYVTFTVPAGFALESITLMDTSLGARGFLGLQSGNQLTLPTNTMTAAGLLGWWHYTPADIDTDLLASMSTPANGSSGFAPPLGAGSYTLWIQDSSPGTFEYGFDVTLAPVPEPATVFTCVASLLGLGLLKRRHNGNT